jgi:ribosomal protein S18 acetylase RimI-like enzyme/predicted nucleic acid-binding protein
MPNIEAIGEDSPLLESVKLLWRPHSRTLGYLPDGAFRDYARQGHLFVSSDGGEFNGYLLYRIVRDWVFIAHFCVAPNARKQGIARALLNHLIATTTSCRGIFLNCRRDFEATKTWPRLGFEVNGEMPGRAAGGSVLVRWLLDYNHPDLFSSETVPEAADAVIDTNIFLDLVDGRSEESMALRADWLQPFVTLCYTSELLNDIGRSQESEVRHKRMGEVNQFKMLRCSPAAYQRAEAILKPLFPNLPTVQDESDFRHLVRAVAAETDVFVTRDGPLLECGDDVFSVCGLSIVRPAELIGRMDVIQHEREYQRNFFAGTRQVMQERISSIPQGLIAAIKMPDERERTLASTLNCLLSDPQGVSCYKLSDSTGVTLAAYAVRREPGIDRIPLLRVCGKRRAGTLARAVLSKIVREAMKSECKSVLVTDEPLREVVEAACSDLGFLSVAGGRLKVLSRGWQTIDQVAAVLPRTDPKIDELIATLPAARTDSEVATRLEHLIWPGKLADAALPCFIVPIKAQFAQHLFDERLASGGLFGADVDLALNSESAYYRAAMPSVVTCPARVLWYVSESSIYQGCKAIRACSRIVEVATGTPKQLFPRFRRLGVYEWSHVLATAKGDKDREIMAFRFDDSELLRPVPWAKFQAILKASQIVNNLQSPVAIPAPVFGEIYAAAFDSS